MWRGHLFSQRRIAIIAGSEIPDTKLRGTLFYLSKEHRAGKYPCFRAARVWDAGGLGGWSRDVCGWAGEENSCGHGGSSRDVTAFLRQRLSVAIQPGNAIIACRGSIPLAASNWLIFAIYLFIYFTVYCVDCMIWYCYELSVINCLAWYWLMYYWNCLSTITLNRLISIAKWTRPIDWLTDCLCDNCIILILTSNKIIWWFV